jgi:hypothetical protein
MTHAVKHSGHRQQLMFLGPRGAAVAAGSGVLAGLLYRAPTLGLAEWRLPDAVCTVVGAVCAPFVHSDPPAAGPRRGAPNHASSTIPAPPQPRTSLPRAHPRMALFLKEWFAHMFFNSRSEQPIGARKHVAFP